MARAGLLSPRAFDTREALLLAFFATFVVLSKAALRWHLHLPGHSMFSVALLLVLARACVRRPAAATLVGLLAGVACALLGMGKGGPLIAFKLVLPGVVVDLGARWIGERSSAVWRAALIGAAAGASHFLPVALVESLAGLDADLVLAHAALSAGTKAGFGALGGAAGAVIAARLRHHGLLPES
jgi:hypothetical protein